MHAECSTRESHRLCITETTNKNDLLKLSNLPITLCCLWAVLYVTKSKSEKQRARNGPVCGLTLRFVSTLFVFHKKNEICH
jgi:hypothetical protein